MRNELNQFKQSSCKLNNVRRALKGRNVVRESTSLLTKHVSARSSLHRRTPPPVRRVRNDVHSRDVTLQSLFLKLPRKVQIHSPDPCCSARFHEGPVTSTRDHGMASDDKLWLLRWVLKSTARPYGSALSQVTYLWLDSGIAHPYGWYLTNVDVHWPYCRVTLRCTKT